MTKLRRMPASRPSKRRLQSERNTSLGYGKEEIATGPISSRNAARGTVAIWMTAPSASDATRSREAKFPSSVIHTITGSSNLRFVVLGIDVNAIKVKGPRRLIDEKKLRALKASIAQIGLQTPITIRFRNKKPELVTGFYRLVAMKQLGAGSIPCYEHYHEESETYLWQRAENVYRAEPRVLDRAEYIDEMRQAILQEGGQVAPPGGRQPKNAGIKKAAKALGFTKEDVRRCKAIAGISAEAKAEARKVGIDDNEHALLEIAKLPATAQCAAVKEIIDRQRAARARLASGAVVASNKKAAAKIQAIEADIAKKKEAIESLKEELSDDRDRLDKVQGKLVEACVNNAMISGPSARSADDDDMQAVLDEPLSPEDEASLKALLADWDEAHTLKRKFAKASPAVRDCFWEKIQQMASVQGGNRETELEASEQEQP